MEIKTKKSEIKPKHYIPVIILILTLAVFLTIINHRRIVKLHEEFPEIHSEDSINEVITDIYTEKGACFLTLKHNKKIFINEVKNCLYDKEYIDQNLQIGDTIKKHEDSDTLYIKNSDKNLYFVIGKVINRK